MGTIDLNLLPIFAAVAEQASFTAAAARLGTPKSTVSRAVASLEQAMGLRLLHRTTRQVSLTAAGEALLARARPHLEGLEHALGDLPELEEQPSGQLRVTASVDVGVHLLPEIATRFIARYPAIELDLRLSNQVVDLVAERFDLALRVSMRALKSSSLLARKAASLDAQLFAAPAYLARRGVPRHPRDLDGHDWVRFPRTTGLRLVSGSEAVALQPRGRLAGDDMAFVREAARAGAGVAMLPMFLAAADLASGDLVRVLPRWLAPAGALWLVTPHTRSPPRKLVVFRDFLLAALRARLGGD